jgi:hypothetical protein
MNGYTLANQFRKLRPSFLFSCTEADLFYELVALCNERNWPTEFQYSNPLLCATLGISEKSLISARNRLKQAGLLEFTSGHKRSPTVYRFLDPDAEIPLPQVSQSGTQNGSQSGTHSGSQSGTSINKEKTKRKTNPPAAAGESENFPFADFWQAYDKKEDKHKCQQRWNTLTPAERQAALAHVPGYVAATPEKRYRKNPLTYLNGKCWQDEETPADRTPAPSTATATPSASFDPDALFGYTQSAADGLAQARQSPEYQRYLAELAQEQQSTSPPAVAAALAHAA